MQEGTYQNIRLLLKIDESELTVSAFKGA